MNSIWAQGLKDGSQVARKPRDPPSKRVLSLFKTKMDRFNTPGAASCVVCPLPSAGKDSQVERGEARQDGTCSSVIWSLFQSWRERARRQRQSRGRENLLEVDSLPSVLKVVLLIRSDTNEWCIDVDSFACRKHAQMKTDQDETMKEDWFQIVLKYGISCLVRGGHGACKSQSCNIYPVLEWDYLLTQIGAHLCRVNFPVRNIRCLAKTNVATWI